MLLSDTFGCVRSLCVLRLYLFYWLTPYLYGFRRTITHAFGSSNVTFFLLSNTLSNSFCYLQSLLSLFKCLRTIFVWNSTRVVASGSIGTKCTVSFVSLFLCIHISDMLRHTCTSAVIFFAVLFKKVLCSQNYGFLFGLVLTLFGCPSLLRLSWSLHDCALLLLPSPHLISWVPWPASAYVGSREGLWVPCRSRSHMSKAFLAYTLTPMCSFCYYKPA